MRPSRDGEILAAYHSSSTLKEAGDKLGLTRERVRQVVAKYGLNIKERDEADLRAKIEAALPQRNVAALARKIGWYPSALLRHMKRYNIRFVRGEAVDAPHDTRRYRYGCRCETCRRAIADRATAYLHGKNPAMTYHRSAKRLPVEKEARG